jgi:hypothetical protein
MEERIRVAVAREEREEHHLAVFLDDQVLRFWKHHLFGLKKTYSDEVINHVLDNDPKELLARLLQHAFKTLEKIKPNALDD